MIASSLSTRSCPTGLCGQCGPCRREMREADRLMIPKVLPPIELSPTARELMNEALKHQSRTRKAAPKPAKPARRTRPAIRHTPLPPTKPTPADIEPCTQCHQPRGLTRGRIDGEGTLCTVCHTRPQLQHTIDTINAIPGPRPKALNTRLSRARLRIQRITHNGRPYHPHAPHGTDNGYVSYQCRCEPCHQAHAELDKARR